MFVLAFSSLAYPVWKSLHFLDLVDCLFSHIWEVSNYDLLNYFLRPFLFFFFFFWNPYNSNVGATHVVPKISETVLISFHNVSFILFHAETSTTLSSKSFFHSSASVILLLVPSLLLIPSMFCCSQTSCCPPFLGSELPFCPV